MGDAGGVPPAAAVEGQWRPISDVTCSLLLQPETIAIHDLAYWMPLRLKCILTTEESSPLRTAAEVREERHCILQDGYM